MHIIMQTVDTMKRNMSVVYENLNQLLEKKDGSVSMKTHKMRQRAATFVMSLTNSQTSQTFQ